MGGFAQKMFELHPRNTANLSGGVGAPRKIERKFLVLLPPFSLQNSENPLLFGYNDFILIYYNLHTKLYNTIMSIANNLKKIRAEKGHSLERVARLADLSLNTIVKIENGTNQNPTITTLYKISKALEVGVDDLIQK